MYFTKISLYFIGTLYKGRVIKTLPVLNRGYRLSFQIRPIHIVYGWANILHATIGGNNGKHGYRTPGIWFYPGSFRLHICSTVGNNVNYFYNSPSLHRYKYANIVVQQIQKAEFGNLFFFQIFINGKKVIDVFNSNPYSFKNVKYYASDPWYAPAKAAIRNFHVVNLPIKGIKRVHLVSKKSVVVYIPYRKRILVDEAFVRIMITVETIQLFFEMLLPEKMFYSLYEIFMLRYFFSCNLILDHSSFLCLS